MSRTSKSRETGRLESFFKGMHVAQVFNNFNVCAEYTKTPSPLRLATALRNVVMQHSMLLCNSINGRISVVEQIKLGDVVTYLSDAENENLDETLSKLSQIRLPYDDTSLPLWRIFVGGKKKNQIHVVFDHIIYDGLSGANFHKCLLEHLNISSCGESFAASIEEFMLYDEASDGALIKSIPPPIEEIVNYKLPVDFIAASSLKGNDNQWKSTTLTKIADEHIFKTMTFTPQETDKIKNMCKQNQSRVAVYIQVCFLVAHSQIESSFDSSCVKMSGYGVDSRRYIEDKSIDTLFGANISSDFVGFKARKSLKWEDVKEMSDNLSSKIETGSIRNFIGGAMYTVEPESWPAIHTHSMLNEKRGALMFGTLGFQIMNKSSLEPKFDIDYMYFSQSSFATNLLYAVNAIATKAGMTIVATVVKNSEESQKFDKLLSTFRNILLQEF